MRFRKRVKVFPGFHLNFSASGISSTIGPRGASINISKRGRYLNTAVPGTGADSRTKLQENNEPSSSHPGRNKAAPFTGTTVEFKSAPQDELSSASLSELKEILNEVYNDRIELSKEIGHTRISLTLSEIMHVLSCLLVIGFVIKFFRESRDEKRDYLADLEQQRDNTHVDIDLHFDATFHKKYQSVMESYKELLASRVIWDITSSTQQDRVASRSAASHVVERLPVSFHFNNIDIIRSSHQAMHFENKNGGDLYIYPGFAIMSGNLRSFALLDLKDLEIELSQQQFIETEKVPADTAVIGKTWAKVNKNGTPDKRFKDNYQIPIVRYAQMDVRSASGLNEVYAVSNYEAAERFVTVLNDYQQLLKN